MRKLRVASWQRSGVAWVPWRNARLLSESTAVQFVPYASCAGLESYGLPEVEVAARLVNLGREVDVIHLHHAYASAEMIPLLRMECPRVKIVVTLHGEPDRTIKRPCHPAPDAYHVVEPNLKSMATNAPCTFIPNHPATKRPAEFRSPGNRVLLVPFSYVPQFKDYDTLGHIKAALENHGWRIEMFHVKQSNAALLTRLGEVAAVWVNLRGYFDLLTCEAWSMGCLPVVKRPERMDEWTAAYGFKPATLFDSDDPESVLFTLSTWDGASTIATNREGMAATWTPERARGQWEAFYQQVCG